MKVIKEDIENLERYIGNKRVDVHAELPLIMADAYSASKNRQEEIDKLLKGEKKEPEIKKKNNKVLGAEKQPVPQMPKTGQLNLEESLFEDVLYTNRPSLYENLTSSKYKDKIGEYFQYTFDFDFLDVVADIVDRVEDFSDSDSYIEAVDDALMYYKDQWTVYQHYAAGPADMTWDEALEAFMDDMYGLLGSLSSGEEAVEESFKRRLKESYDTDTVAKILSGDIPMPKRGFKYLSSNDTSGEVMFKGTKYAFRKKDDGSYKVMRSSDAGWNWSETLFKESKGLKEDRGRKADPFIDSQGNSYGDEDRSIEEDDDIYTTILTELSPEHQNWMRKTKIKDIPVSKRYDYNDLEFTDDYDVVIHGQDDSDFELAKRVADAYGLKFEGPRKRSSYDDGLVLTIRMPKVD